ncbi:DUF4826 family protein [Mesorhizobium captivum]|uniref:DUF4826 family protein n=1 Tax=Mesorhizobium captivum TaxID=3072319 RepID=UPI003D314F90
MTDEADDLNEAEDQVWCDSQRQYVIDYLSREGLEHGRVGEWPAWHVSPYVAIWAIESITHPGWVGWWAISGDLPTDYVVCGPERTPRAAVREFGLRWKEAAVAMPEGREPDEVVIGRPEDAAMLAPLLGARAETLLGWANDDSVWDDDP